MALQQAVEKATFGLIMEGVDLNLWQFADVQAAEPLMELYRNERDGIYEARDVQRAVRKAGSLSDLRIIEQEEENEGT